MTTPITVTEARLPDDLDTVLAFTRDLYRDDPCYVPPLDLWVRRRLSQRNPQLERFAFTLLIARRAGAIVGTISVLRDPGHEKRSGERCAFFGFFECVDDPAVARALFDAAESRGRALGATTLRGPRNLSRVEEVGILVEGHDTTPPMLASHHRRSYPALVESEGFVPHHDILAYDIELYLEDGTPRPMPERLAERAAGCRIDGLELRPMRWRTLGRDLDLAHRVFVDAFRDVPDNTPMPKRQFAALAGVGIALASRHMLQLATIDGEAAGFALCFPELYEATRAANGRVLPLGWARMAWALRSVRTASFKLLGVLPEHRHHGLHAVMIDRAVQGCRDAGFTRLEASLIDGRNAPMRRIVESAGMQVYRRYLMYERPIARSVADDTRRRS